MSDTAASTVQPAPLPPRPAGGAPAVGSVDAAGAARASWRRTFYALCASQAIAMLAFGMALPFLPLYVQQLGIADPREAAAWAGAMSSGGALVMAVMAPIWGALADRYGRKSMVTRALLGGGAVVALMNWARTPVQLLGLRTVQGAFSGTVSASRTLLAAVAPEAELGFALGTMQTASFVGNSAGPLVGGLVADRVGFGPTFLCTGLLLVASGVAVTRLVHEDFRPPDKTTESSAAQTLRASLRVLVDVPGLGALIATLFFVQAGMSAMGPILPLFVQGLLPPGDQSVASLSGLVLGSTAVTSALAAGFAGKAGDRLGHERVLAACAVCGGLLYLPQALVTSAWQLLAFRTVLGVFTGGLMPGVMATIAVRSPAARRGWVFGLTATATSLGNAVGPAASAAVAGAFGLRATFVFTALVLTASGTWVALALRRRHPGMGERGERLVVRSG